MGSSAVGAAASRTVAQSTAATAALGLAIAATVRFSGAASGSHGVSAWGPLGLAVIAVAAAAACVGRRIDGRAAAAGALFAAVGAWAVASTEWGGIRSVAWTSLDQSLIAGAALVAGALLVGGALTRAGVLAGVVVGEVALAAEILVRLGVDSYPKDWWAERFLIGPAGYKNAQAILAALAIPLALWLAAASRPAVRIAGAAAATLLLSTLLLTQSRGALTGVAVATVAQVVLLRRRRVAVAAGALVAAGLVLAYPLTRVDSAALTGSRAELAATLRDYVAASGAAAVLSALVVLAGGRWAKRRLAGAAGLLVLAFLVIATTQGDRVLAAIRASASGGNPVVRAPGHTALTGLSSNGRWQAWKIAWRMIEHDPLRGHGAGSFSISWLADPHQTIHLLQPHSIELELLSELGMVGLLLFLGACWFAVAALRRAPDRAAAAAAGLALATLVIQSSVDWTWSFPGAVVPALLAVGAAIGSGRGALPARSRLSIAIVGALFLVSVGAPYAADRERRSAASLATTSPVAAADRARSAHSIDPLNPEIMLLQGRLAEALGEYRQAALAYTSAAHESREQWIGFADAARAWKLASARGAAIDACKDAILANPNRQDVLRGICGGSSGRAWPVDRIAASSVDAYRAAHCAACTISVSGDLTRARAGGWADFENLAFRSLPVVDATARDGAVLLVEDRVSLPDDHTPGNLVLLEVRDERGALIFSIFARGTTGAPQLWLYNPPGGIHVNSFVQPTGAGLVPGRSVCVQVAYEQRRFLRVAVDGVVRIAMPGRDLPAPSGATTVRPKRLLVGILGYAGPAVGGDLNADHLGAAAKLVSPAAGVSRLRCR